MSDPVIGIEDAQNLFSEIARRAPALLDQGLGTRSPDTPVPGLLEGIGGFLKIAARYEEMPDRNAMDAEDITRVGDYGLSMLMNLDIQVHKAEAVELAAGLRAVVLASADWVVRHGGRIQTLEPVVDALAMEANARTDPGELRSLSHFTGRIIRGCGTPVRRDLEQMDAARPWRLLHLNYCIAATRSHDTGLMEQAFDALVQTLPADAPSFFEEGMSEMERLGYPQPVRDVMQRYHESFTRRRMN